METSPSGGVFVLLVPPLKYLVRGYLQSEKATGLTATAQVCRPNRLDPIGSTAIADGERGTERAVTTALGVENGIDVFAIATLCTNSERLNITHR